MITIALASFKEALKKKIIILVGLLTVIYLVLFGIITYYVVKDLSQWNGGGSINGFLMASQVVSVLGFYFSSMLVAFLTIMASISSISSEIESGLLHSIITRPIRRSEYVLGKYIGLAALVVCYSVFLYVSVLAICTVLKLPSLNSISIGSLGKGLLFFILQPIAILSLSIFGNVSFKTITNGIFVISVYVLGLIGSMMEQIGSLMKNGNLINWGIFSSLISPFDVIYRQMLTSIYSTVGITNPLFGPNTLTNTTPSKWMMIYIFVYIVGLALLAVKKFQRKDIG